MQTKQHHRLLALLMTVVMFFQITVMSPFAAFAEDTDTSVVLGNEEQQINTETGKEEEPSLRAASGTTTVLTFTSDIHNQSNNTAANRLDGWLDFVKETYGGVDVMSFCGDMGSASGSGDSWWSYVTSVKAVVDEQNIPGVYTTGNHEFYNGSFSSTTNAMKSNYKVGAEGISGDNFRIYCLGTDNWNNNQDNYTTGQVSTLTNYLNSVDDSKPIIVLTHFPLHHYSSRTTTNADLVINALNTAANSGKKIVLLWGHNHTMLDTNYDEIFEPGSVVEYASGKTATFNFYYAAAGCMSDSEYGNGSAYVKGKGLVITINNKNQLSFTYYDANRNNVTEGGTYTEQDPVPIESAVIDEAITKDENGQPVIVVPTLEVGRTLQLHITTDPEDATQKSVTWESSNTSVATVDANGKVKGIAAGTSTITVTVSDGITRGTATASVDIEILPRSSSGPMYVLTDTFEAGKNYIIANKNDGTAYALTNNNGSVAVTAVEVEGDTIYLDEENDSIVFTTSGSGTNVTDIVNNGRYLGVSNGSASFSTSARNIAWTYSSNKLSSKRSSSSSTNYYLYYSTSNNTYSASSSSSSTSSPRELYLFEEVVEQVAVNGVSVIPKTATIDPRKTVELTATVSPSNATNKKITWSSSNTSVATVDENGKVRGVAQGTAVITATSAADNSKKDICTVTVTDVVPTDPNYVIVIDGYALSTDRSPNTAQGGSSSYTYTGLAGVVYADGDAASDNIRWVIEETTGGYYIKDLDDNYLNATYTSGNSSGKGDLKLDDTPDVWVLDSGYSLENGTVDGSKLKSTNATNQAGSSSGAKYLSYEDGANLFSVRSESNADEISIIEASDPVAVESVAVTPKIATVEARKTIELTATVSPANATNKKVTWSSSDTSVATVDVNGKVKGVAEGTAVITATAGEKSDTCTVSVTPSTVTEKTYVITVGNFALSTNTTTDQPSNNNGAYIYTGLAGAAFDPDKDPEDDVRWILEETDTENGYFIMSLDGRYLNATYTAPTSPSSSNPARGVLKLDDTPDIWVLDGSLDSWEVDGSMLKSTNASSTASSAKFLAYEEGSTSSPLNLFTVRSEGNADETTLVDPTATIVERFVETDKFEDGKEYIIAVTKDNGSIYAVKNISGTSTGNTGSVVMTVFPASGDKPAYIEEVDTGAVWTYSGSNNRLATSNSHFLGYESSTYLPRVSSQAQSITYSGGKLSIGTNHYLTCDDGTFATVTSSGSGADVRIFVKKVEIITCEHSWGQDPVWTWTGVGAKAEPTASATFTCTKCGETKTIAATVTGPVNRVYTASVKGPDGNTYTDTRTEAITGSYYVKVYSDTQYASEDQEVGFKIALGPVDQILSFEVQLVIPDGWEYVTGSLQTVSGAAAATGFSVLDVSEDNLKKVFGTSLGDDIEITEEVDIATFRCKVNSTGTVTFNENDHWEFWSFDTEITELYSPIPATVTVNALTVTYNANSGTGTMANQTVYQGVKANLTENGFARTGFTFNGWNTAADGTGTSYADKAEVTLNANLSLYAQWQVIEYTITYNTDGGLMPDGSATKYNVTDKDITLQTPTKEGYEFGGWYTTSEFSGDPVTTIKSGSTGDKEFFAKWTEKLYTLSGTVKSFVAGVADEDGIVTVALYNGETKITEDTFECNADNIANFTFENVTAGTYRIEISKLHHATRNVKDVKVNSNVSLNEIKINLMGDINGDGNVTTIDYALANWHVRYSEVPEDQRENYKRYLLDDYEIACADLNGNGEVTTAEAAQINQHARKLGSLWSA